jgi:hypothetical protein
MGLQLCLPTVVVRFGTHPAGPGAVGGASYFQLHLPRIMAISGAAFSDRGRVVLTIVPTPRHAE